MRLEKLYEAIKIGKILKDCEFKVLDKLDNLSWEKSIIFISSKEYLNKLNNPLISGVICPKDLALEVQNNFNIGIWIYNKPKELFYLAHEYLINNDYYFKPKQNNISSKAIISPKAIISAHSVNIGSGSVVNDYAIIKHCTTIGKNTMIGSSSVIGGDGFEGLRILGKLSAVKHAGIITIEDDVEIQALNCISKGLFPTRNNIINNGVKTSDQVHINHGVIIGEETMIGPGVTISGNVTIGKNVWLAPGVVVSNRIKIGDTAEIKHTITQIDIEKFVDLTGDDNKIHVDEEYASTTSFKKPVAHGMLGASFISTIIGTKLPGDGALWYAQNLEFLQPVRVGDELRITVEVIKKIDRTKTIKLQTDIYNQHKQKVTTGTATIKIVETTLSKVEKEKSKTKKTALIIGGTGGIGSAVCIQLAKDGFDIAIHYFKNKTKADKLKKELEKIGSNAVVVSGDIVSLLHVQEIKDKSMRAIGNISVIVNCSTIPVPNIRFGDLEWKDMQAHYNTNVRGSFNLLKAFVEDWEKNQFGKFIALTTLYTEQLKSELLGYITGKTALNGFVKALAFELAPKGIRINLVSPGMVDTPLIADVSEKVRLLSAAQTPLRVLATAEDVAGAISFLASDKSNYLTGETIRVNGGQFML